MIESLRLVFGYDAYIKFHSYPKVRCSFWHLSWANGCMYDCAYCWLKAYHPWPWEDVHVANKDKLSNCLKRFYHKPHNRCLLNADELCDSLVAGWEYVKFMASEVRQLNEEYGKEHKILLLTKAAQGV